MIDGIAVLLLGSNVWNWGSMDAAYRGAKGEDFFTEDSSPSMAVQTSACLISGCSAVVPRCTVTGYQDVALLSCTHDDGNCETASDHGS